MLPKATSVDELFEQDDRPAWDIDVPAWGKSVTIRELDASTGILVRKSTTDDKGNLNRPEFMARTILEGLVEPKMQPSDLERLKKRNYSAFLTLYNAISDGKKKRTFDELDDFEQMVAEVCFDKGCFAKNLKNVSREELGIQYQLLLKYRGRRTA